MFDDIWLYMCLLNSLVDFSFNVISLRIAVDRRTLPHTLTKFFILIAVLPFMTLCILEVLFIAFPTRNSLFVMCRKTQNSAAMHALKYCIYQRSSAIAAISNTDRPQELSLTVNTSHYDRKFCT